MTTKKAANRAANENDGKSTEKTVTAPKKKPEKLRDFNKLNIYDGNEGNPSTLANDYIISIMEGKTLQMYLKEFEFKSENEIKEAVTRLVYAIALDPHLSNPSNRKEKQMYKVAFNLAKMISPEKVEAFVNKTASDLWHSFHAPRIRKERHDNMFTAIPDKEKFLKASETLIRVYGLDYTDIYRFRLFALQLREGEYYPASDTRILYLYGNLKKSGKTTVAKQIVAIGNGEVIFRPEFETTLSHELGTTRYDKLGMPAIGIYNCVLIDEAFYKDMGKTYADFKALVTTTGGICRLPYGQPIPWTGRANYVFTSNDSLQTFIKDSDDRRFLPIEFRQKPEPLHDYDLAVVIKDFITNATVPEGMTLKEFVEQVAGFSDVEGERSLETRNLVGVMSSSTFLAELRSKPYELFIPSIKSMVLQIEPSYRYAKIGDEIYRAAMRQLFGKSDNERCSWRKKHMEEVLEALEANREAEEEVTPF